MRFRADASVRGLNTCNETCLSDEQGDEAGIIVSSWFFFLKFVPTVSTPCQIMVTFYKLIVRRRRFKQIIQRQNT